MELDRAARMPWMEGSRRPPSVARAVTVFAVAGLAAVALIALVGSAVLRRIGTHESISDAKQVTRLAGRGIVAPQVTSGVIAGDPAALARLDRVVRARVLGDGVVRVKLWDASGRIVYSDEPRLIGSRYALGPDELHSLRGDSSDAEVSDLSRPENRFERGERKLLEVYLPIRARNGRTLLFESYQRFSSITANSHRLLGSFGPTLIGALILLELIQLPLAWSIARRLRQGHAERERLLWRAIEASDVERRRIASELHDGAVQRLAGVSYALEAAAQRANGDESADGLRACAAEARETVRELRALLVEIYPPSLQRAGLGAAVADLVSTVRAGGIEADVEIPAELGLSPDVEALFFRTAQEGLRNVVSHAGAERVWLQVARSNGHASLTVADDGRGMTSDERERARAEGHFGLRLIEDLANQAGGRLELDSAQGAGTRLRVEVPVT